MSTTKNRQTIYNVVRTFRNSPSAQPVIVGSFRTSERADEIKGKYEQEMKDIRFDEFKFEVQASTYYDE